MKIESLKETPVYEPSVSIIIPTWRNSQVLRQCLQSLEEVDYPYDKIEVILVTRNEISLKAELHLTVRILQVDKEYNHAQMRNEAVRICKGEILAFIDDDVIVNPDWLRNGLRYFLLPQIGGIGGPGVAVENLSFSDRCSYYTLASPFSSGFSYMRYFNSGITYEGGENDLILCNNLIRRGVFNEVGGFHPEQIPCEENELYRRIIDKGWRLFYVSDMEVKHYVKPVFVMIRKAFWYGVGRGSFIIRRPRCNMKPKIYIPSLSLLFISSFSLFSIFSPLARYFLATYLVLYSFNMLQHLAFVFRKFSKNPIFWFVLPPITFFFHHAYGLGVMVGILKSLFLNKKESKMHDYFRAY